MSRINNLNNINEEGIKKSSKHIDRQGSSRFNWKKIVLFIVVIAGVAVATFKSIPFFNGKYVVPEIPYSVTDTIEINSSDTFLDELLKKQAKDSTLPLLERVTELEINLNMSRKLEDLNLSEYTDTVVEIEETETFYKDLDEKYQRFLELTESTDKKVLSQEALDLYSIAAELNGYKAVLNSKVTIEGYDIVIDYGILVVKTAIIDASGISHMDIDNLRIPHEDDEYVVIYTDPETNVEFKTKIPGSSIIHRVMNNVYRAQSVDKESLTTTEVIADLTEYLNDAKVASFMRFNNNGSLQTTNNYNDVRELIEIPKTK